MAFNTFKSEVSKLDEEIHFLEDRLNHLRAARNALVPIGHLPPEVLERIFNIARGLGTHTIHLSWVSRVWRTLTLGRKTLWTVINDSNVQWTSIYLERSFPAPLIVDFESPFSQENLFIKIMEHFPRFKALVLPSLDWEFEGVNEVVEGALSKNGPTPHPHLEFLQLSGGEVTKEMFLGLQNIRHLLVLWNDIDWTIQPPLPYLKSLTITFAREHVPLRTLLDCLESMPALTTLNLEKAFPPISDEARLITRRSFPNGPKLASLSLMSDFDMSMELLRVAGCITQETSVLVYHLLDAKPLDQIKGALETFNTWATSRPGGQTRDVTHLGLDGDSIVAAYGNAEDTSAKERAYTQLKIRVIPHLRGHLPVVPVLPQLLPLQNLHLLWINPNRMDASTWQVIANAFGYLPKLRHLAISTEHEQLTAEFLLNIMSTKQPGELNTEAPRQLAFSPLKTLLLPYYAPRNMEVLHSFLLSRKQDGLKLGTLGLSKSDDVVALRELVEENMGAFADEVVNAGEKGYFAKEERFSFLQHLRVARDISPYIFSLITDS